MRNLGFEWEGLEWWSHQPKNEQMDLMGSSGIVLGKQGEYHGTYHQQCDLGSFPKGAQQWWLTFFGGGILFSDKQTFCSLTANLDPIELAGPSLGLLSNSRGSPRNTKVFCTGKVNSTVNPTVCENPLGVYFHMFPPKFRKEVAVVLFSPPGATPPNWSLKLWPYGSLMGLLKITHLMPTSDESTPPTRSDGPCKVFPSFPPK